MIKRYIKPSVSIIDVEMENLLAASGVTKQETSSVGTGSTPVGDDDPTLGKEHTGFDLWE